MVRRLTHVLILVLTLMVGATAMAVIVSQTAWFKDWLRGYIERQAANYLNGQLSIHRLGGNLFFGVELENIGVSMNGSEVVAVKDVGLDYNLFQLIASGLSVDNIRLNQPVIYLRREGDAWSISRLIKREASEADREGPGRPITIEAIGVTDGAVVIDGPVGTSGVVVPKRVDDLDAQLAFRYEPVRYTIDISNVTFRGSDPEIALNALSGGVSVHDDSVFVDKLVMRTAESTVTINGAVEQYLTSPVFKVEVNAEKFSLPEWAAVVPALDGIALQPAFDVKTNGPADRLGLDLSVRSKAGHARAALVADLLLPEQSVNGTLSVDKLDLAPLTKRPNLESDITGSVTVDARVASLDDLETLRGHADLKAPRIAAAGFSAERVDAKADFNGRDIAVDGTAAAYGTSVTTAGRVTLPEKGAGSRPLTFDLRGQVRGLDLRRLPAALGVPPASTRVAAAYRAAGTVPVAGTAKNLRAEARFLPSTIAGTSIANGSTVGVSIQGEAVRYDADVTLSGLDVHRLGREFRLPALADQRYTTALNGHVAASGEGIDPRTLTLDAHGTLENSLIVGGRISQLDFDASASGDTARLKARGSFDGVNPEAMSGRPAMHGDVDGRLDIDATITNVSAGVTADSVRATAMVNLDPSTIGGLQITGATLDADYHDSTGDIRALEVAGRDLNVKARGTLALNDAGQSNLTVHADSSQLAELGRLIDQPLGGIGSVDATVTGNRRELTAAGTISGGGLKYGETSALNATSEFRVAVPDLDAANARVSATTHGTFVTIAGQEINEITATTELANKQLTFTAAAKQPQRSLDAAGDVLLHPDHQELHLNRLALQSQGVSWTTDPASRPTVQYGRDVVTVRDLRLVNGDQRIAAEGSFGRPGDAVKVALDNIDLATVDALMLQPPRFTGRLTASATVSGSRSQPAVDADFRINQGGFRQFRYDSFGGTVTYAGSGVQLDARLDQNPTAWLTAKGYAPLSLFKPRPDARILPPHSAPATPDERVDLQIDSTPIDLGVVQGFTTAVSNVTGTVEAHVRLTGSGDDPHPDGTVAFNEGAFTVDASGVSYAHLRGDVQLQGDTIHIDTISVLDNHDSALSLTGDLGVHEQQVGGVQLYVTARDFKVIDNELGNVRLNSDIEVTGELRAPRIDGDVSVNTGEINLDQVVALTSSSAYSTTPTEYLEPPAPAPDAEASASRSMVDGVRMNLRLSVPDDLVLKASSLETPGSPISIGAFTITLGGDLEATMEPGDRPRLRGVVNTVRGFYDFQGRRFTILRDGTIRFVGGDELDPLLDLRAERVIRAVTANVNVRGTVKQPEIVLSSTPPLEQADILSLIVFNQPANELGSGQQLSLTQRAQGLAAGAAAGALTRSIGSALNLDEFAINLAPETGEAAQLTIGQQVGQDLYVRVQQGLGDQSQTNFVLEYELTDWLRLQTNVLQGSTTQQQLFKRMQGSGADLIFFFSY
jgi:hypothetical protein